MELIDISPNLRNSFFRVRVRVFLKEFFFRGRVRVILDECVFFFFHKFPTIGPTRMDATNTLNSKVL